MLKNELHNALEMINKNATTHKQTQYKTSHTASCNKNL